MDLLCSTELLEQHGNVHGPVSDLDHVGIHERRKEGRVHSRQKQLEAGGIPEKDHRASWHRIGPVQVQG